MGDATASARVPATVRTLERIALILGFGVAAAMFGLRIVGSDMPLSVSLPGAVAFAATVLVMGAFVVLFLHLDPRCADTYANGEVRLVPQERVDMESGWAWDIGGTSSSSMTSRSNVVSQVCSSDIVTWPEALVSLALAGVAATSAYLIVPSDNDDRVVTRELESPPS